jgi:hypothetical protein
MRRRGQLHALALAVRVSEDGYLLPVRKDQRPPDLKYFSRPRK